MKPNNTTGTTSRFTSPNLMNVFYNVLKKDKGHPAPVQGVNHTPPFYLPYAYHDILCDLEDMSPSPTIAQEVAELQLDNEVAQNTLKDALKLRDIYYDILHKLEKRYSNRGLVQEVTELKGLLGSETATQRLTREFNGWKAYWNIK